VRWHIVNSGVALWAEVAPAQPLAQGIHSCSGQVAGCPIKRGQHQPHHYSFVLIATDFDPTELPSGLTRDEVIAKIAPDNGTPVHAKGDAGLVGLFVNRWRQ
jgi:phosphatidylethanolamine-binding protein (PEBP) family uncharacterized protein